MITPIPGYLGQPQDLLAGGKPAITRAASHTREARQRTASIAAASYARQANPVSNRSAARPAAGAIASEGGWFIDTMLSALGKYDDSDTLAHQAVAAADPLNPSLWVIITDPWYNPFMEITVLPPDHLTWNGHRVRCALGRNGIRSGKKDGDGATPAGIFPLRRVLYRSDRLDAPNTGLTVQAIEPDDGWCDDPTDSAYNQRIKRPFTASHEVLWRGDHVYDVIVELGHNDNPPAPGLGSAIFLHVARPDFEPTEGCVALRMEDLLALLARCNEGAVIAIPGGEPG